MINNIKLAFLIKIKFKKNIDPIYSFGFVKLN